MKRSKKTIAIGGMIGLGKSTVINGLREKGFHCVDEYADDDIVFNTLLSAMYNGVQGAELPLQTYFIVNHNRTTNKSKDIAETVVLDRYIIEHMLFAMNNLNGAELSSYYQLFFDLMQDTLKPDLYIILTTDTIETVFDRIKSRGRECEIVGLEANKQYFINLWKTYNNKLKGLCHVFDIPFVEIKVNIGKDEVLEKVLTEINKVEVL